jgi:hypothetical protein
MGRKEMLTESVSENPMEIDRSENMAVDKKIFKWITEKQVMRM